MYEVGADKGKYYSINIPLKDGIDDQSEYNVLETTCAVKSYVILLSTLSLLHALQAHDTHVHNVILNFITNSIYGWQWVLYLVVLCNTIFKFAYHDTKAWISQIHNALWLSM